MIDKEKVLHVLDSCGFYDGIPNICEVTECPYRDDKAYCVHELAHDAGKLISELLKAHEPRLVTESDFNGEDAYGYMPVWTEEKDGDMYWECIPKAAITDPDGIGVLRYWTSRPTKEQREAVPWD